jgi:hypothetical protein
MRSTGLALVAVVSIACGTSAPPAEDRPDGSGVVADGDLPAPDSDLPSPDGDLPSPDGAPTEPADAVAETATDGAAGDPFGAAYPAGPYGLEVGDTLPGREWVGYVNVEGTAVSTTKPFGPTSLDVLRRGGNYGLIHVSDYG